MHHNGRWQIKMGEHYSLKVWHLTLAEQQKDE